MFTTGVLECSRPEQLVPMDYLVNHGFTWVNTAECNAAQTTTAYLQVLGYSTAFHPVALPAAFAPVLRVVQ
jgi:hypothetical protein